jgi:tetratricopeptide (TPR) repeat protein
VGQRRPWLAARTSDFQRQSDLWLLRGDDLTSLGLSARALDAYLRAIEIDSLSTAARLQAGTLYVGIGDLPRAQGQFDRVLEISPSHKGAHFGRGVLAYRRGDVQSACREFERELEIDPASGEAHINLAMCYEEHLKDFRQAALHLRRYIDLKGGTDELRNHLKELEARERR